MVEECILINTVKNNHTNTIILDGVLSFLLKSIKEYSKLESEIVLTPHPGEASELLDASVEEIQDDRCAAAEKIAEKYMQMLFSKGNRTIVCSKPLRYECAEGGPELSTGVLAMYWQA